MCLTPKTVTVLTHLLLQQSIWDTLYLPLLTRAKFEHFDAISKVVLVNPNFPMSVGKKELIMSIQIFASKTSKLVRLSNIEITSE